MKEIIRLGVVLMVIAASSAAVLTMTDMATAPRIEMQLEQEKMDALLQVLPEAVEFRELKEEIADLLADDRFAGLINEVWVGSSGGRDVGSVYVVSPVGYGGPIVTMVAIDADDEIAAVYVLSASQETPGLGLAVMEPWFLDRFVGKDSREELQVVKSKAMRSNEIEAITAATISAEAVVYGVNTAARFHHLRIREMSAVAFGGTEQLLKEMITDAAEFKDMTDVTKSLITSAAAEHITEVWEAVGSDKQSLGYVVRTSTDGFGGPVVTLVSFDREAVVTGIKIVAMTGETAGLGTKIAEESFLSQMIGVSSAEGLTLIKSGPAGANEVVAVSGATLSSRAVVRGVNAGIEAVVALLAVGGE